MKARAAERAPWLNAVMPPEIDWESLERLFPLASDLRACPQDPVFHAEGDVWTHTRMVVEALERSPSFRELPEDRRHTLRIAALLHDIGKPATTEREWDVELGRERIRQPGHARLGARMSWSLLWRANAPLQQRLAVYWLIAWHQRPFYLWHARDMLRMAIDYSLVGEWDDLLALVNADNAGRICDGKEEAALNLLLLREWLAEHGLLGRAWPFSDAETRMQYLEKRDRSPHFSAHPVEGSRVVLLCGLPGAGKDTYAKTAFPDWPQISLDALRGELGVSPEDEQGAVIQAAYERARVYLRAKKSFVWNATNVTQSVRGKVIGLLRAYGAHIAIHVIDRPFETVSAQNAERAMAVPAAAVARLADKFEPPSLLEAHEVIWV